MYVCRAPGRSDPGGVASSVLSHTKPVEMIAMNSVGRSLTCIPRWLRLFSALLFVALAGHGALAQTVVGRISGTVKDPSGAVVAGASVAVTNAATNLERTVKTDEDGFYTVTNLPVGTYTVSVEQAGFKKAV